MIPPARQLPTPFESSAAPAPGNAVAWSPPPVSEDVKREARKALREYVNDRLDKLPDAVLNCGNKRIIHRELKLLRIPDDERATGKTKRDFMRLWKKRDEYLEDHEQEVVLDALRDDPSARNVVRHTNWLARTLARRTGDFF